MVLLQRKQTRFRDLSAGESRVGCPCAQSEGDDDGYCVRLCEHAGECSHKASQREGPGQSSGKRGFGAVLVRGG